MKREHIVRLFAGIFVLTGILLAYLVHSRWIWLAVFAGTNLFQSSLTKYCPLQKLLRKFDIGEE